MNFKYDKGTVLIVLAGCLLLGAWFIYLPKYQKKRAAEYQEMLRNAPQVEAPQQIASETASAPVASEAAGQPVTVENAAAAITSSEHPQLETKTVALENKVFHVTIDGLRGSISGVELSGPRFSIKGPDGAARPIELFPSVMYRTFELASPTALVPVSLEVRETEQPRSAEVVRTFANGLKLVQTFSLPEEDNYLVTCKYVWSNTGSAPLALENLGVRLAGLPTVETLTGDKVSTSERMNIDFCKAGRNSVITVDPKVKSQEKFLKKTTCEDPVAWISSSNKYFASLLFADEKKPFASLSGERVDRDAVPFMTGHLDAVTLAPGGSEEFVLTTYCGPKELSRIGALGSSVKKVMHISYYSWFEFLARPMLMLLNWLKSLCGSYGIAIILLTLLVRIVCWPVTQKANSSMRRMQKIQPKIKALQEKYKADPMDSRDDSMRKKAELNQKMMELYRVEKVNPLGGCLPIFLQIPVFIALYSALDSAVELRNVSFLWCSDLSRPDLVGPTLPFALPFIGRVGFHPLVIAMTALMIVQQKMTPSTADASQQKMMMIIPIVMLFMFYNLPSGLTLYWTVSQIFSILQMKYGQYAAKRDEARQAENPQKA